MFDVIFENRVYAKRTADSWTDAVDVAGKIWLEQGLCEQKYIDLVKKQLEENNAYAVILPGLVLLHAAAGYGVKENSLMLITLDQPVCFQHPENDPVKVMICFTALDTKAHVSSMRQIARMLFDDDFVDYLWQADSDEELLRRIIALEEKL